MKDVSRRDFLKYVGIGALGLVARPKIVRALEGLPLDGTFASDVVQCFDAGATSGSSTINEPIVQVMVDESIKALTGVPDVGAAWQSVFPGITESSVIGIKVNCINSLHSTHPAVVNCIVSGLARMDFGGTLFRKNNIILWDESDSYLTSGGYTIYDGADPTRVRCFGTSHSGIGYDTINFNVNGVTSHPSKILSQFCDYIVDAAVLRTHSIANVTLTMKNHYGSVNNPGSLHGGSCSPYIPALNAQIRDVVTPNNIQKLFFIDGLFALYSGGPGGSPNFNPKLILMSRDPVACDTQGQNVINVERQAHGLGALNAAHIRVAAQAPYNLGTTDVNLIEINNPTGVAEPGRGAPANAGLAVTPHPFRTDARVSFAIPRAATVSLDLVDASGRVRAALFCGRLGRGRHDLPIRAAGLAAGSYFLRLTGRDGTQVRAVTVLN